jgi:hypothetical protein
MTKIRMSNDEGNPIDDIRNDPALLLLPFVIYASSFVIRHSSSS